MNRSVAVTGVGVVSAFGVTFRDFWKGVSAGQSAIRPMTLVPPGSLRFSNGAEVPNFQTSQYFDDKEAMLLDRFSQLAAVAAREAITGSGLELTEDLREKTAVVLGCCVGGKTSEDIQFHNLYALGESRLSPFTIPRVMGNAAASRISLEYGITGPVY